MRLLLLRFGKCRHISGLSNTLSSYHNNVIQYVVFLLWKAKSASNRRLGYWNSSCSNEPGTFSARATFTGSTQTLDTLVRKNIHFLLKKLHHCAVKRFITRRVDRDRRGNDDRLHISWLRFCLGIAAWISAGLLLGNLIMCMPKKKTSLWNLEMLRTSHNPMWYVPT